MLADRTELFAVFAGGCAGALARALLGKAVPSDAGDWPWATFAANVGGAFLLGWLVTRVPATTYRHPRLGTGLCGALTTFSTLQLELLETHRQRADGRLRGAALNLAVSLVLGLACAWAGRELGLAL